MFHKILIANRGEIACRIIGTARRMGIKTVAVWSAADSRALHVQVADEAIFIGPSPSTESYLEVSAIVQACKESGADAVHPGYGFLSENAAFADALAEADIAFIGPSRQAITAMGDKIASKKLAENAGVSTIPGYTEVILNAEQAVDVASQIGYPVMLKASAGGGGKGMRIAWNDSECRDGFERATNEARSSFGDERVFIEKFIDHSRHIEIQVLADGHGNAIHLGERECSIQRRHQKVIEEAPSPFLDEETREAMARQALALAKAVNYRSAGTVEFIVDKDRNFYFLEMNTRLQVEHPVTEMVTGLDLVELMIRVANGEELPISQSDVKIDGWSIEARVYAEDPLHQFLPSTGRLLQYRPPLESNFMRLDTGVYEGAEISMHYDPLIAKLVTSGSTREQARIRMCVALDEFYIRGVSHNIGFLAALMRHPRFAEGRLSTDFIREEYPDGFHGVTSADAALLLVVAASLHVRAEERAMQINQQMTRHARTPRKTWVVCTDSHAYAVEVTPVDGGHRVVHDDLGYTVCGDWQIGSPRFYGRVNDEGVCVQVEKRGPAYRLSQGGFMGEFLVLTPRAAELRLVMPVKAPPDMSKFLLSPMPGLLVNVAVDVGDEVTAGQQLAVIEAMKMENLLQAEHDGKVIALIASPGDTLAVDQPIIQFE